MISTAGRRKKRYKEKLPGTRTGRPEPQEEEEEEEDDVNINMCTNPWCLSSGLQWKGAKSDRISLLHIPLDDGHPNSQTQRLMNAPIVVVSRSLHIYIWLMNARLFDAACTQPMAANDDAGAGNEAAANDGGQDGEKPVVLITGCAKGGIGYEYCRAFSALGCRVVATDIPDRVPDLAADLAGDGEAAADDTLVLPLDVTSDASVAAAVRRVLAEHGRIDVLVNNAGIGCTGPLAELPLDSVRRAMDVNFLGQVRMVRAVAPHMASSSRGRGGRVVNVGSVVGTAATPWAAPYCASKAAVHAATDALRLELRPFGVHVVKVVPGAVRSALGRANAAALEAAGGRRREWEMYREFAAAIEERARASQAGGATEAAAFARHVARKVMRPRPPREIVYGSMTLLFAALAAAPAWARDAFFARRFGLHGKKKMQ